ARLHGDRHVAGGIVDHLIERTQIDADAGLGGPVAETEQGASAQRIERLAGTRSAANQIRQLLYGCGTLDGYRAEAIDQAGGLAHAGFHGRNTRRVTSLILAKSAVSFAPGRHFPTLASSGEDAACGLRLSLCRS